MAGEVTRFQRCKVCRQRLVPAYAVLFRAFGQPLFAVHQGSCELVVQGAIRTAGKLSILGAGLILQARAPALLASLKSFTATMKQLRKTAP